MLPRKFAEKEHVISGRKLLSSLFRFVLHRHTHLRCRGTHSTATEIKPMFFHKPSMTSTYDTSESIATPLLESDLDDDQIRKMLASPLYLLEREASADRSLVNHSFRENLVSSSSHFRESAGKLAALFSHKRKSSQDTFSDRDGISSRHQTVQGKCVFFQVL